MHSFVVRAHRRLVSPRNRQRRDGPPIVVEPWRANNDLASNLTPHLRAGVVIVRLAPVRAARRRARCERRAAPARPAPRLRAQPSTTLLPRGAVRPRDGPKRPYDDARSALVAIA